MKTKLLFLSAIVCGALNLSAQDLAPGINYSYNPPGANGIITSISVDVVENDGTSASSFDVAMYLYDQSTSTAYILDPMNVSYISGYGVYSITNWNVDINNTPGIPAGTYRLGFYVDSNSDISESDENNNAGLLSGNINYTPSANGIEANSILANSLNLFPNPANEMATVNFTLEESAAVTLNIYDMTGKLVQVVTNNDQMLAGDYSMKIETASLPEGAYFLTLTSGELSVTRRLIVAH
jgi:hypothetical protein